MVALVKPDVVVEPQIEQRELSEFPTAAEIVAIFKARGWTPVGGCYKSGEGQYCAVGALLYDVPQGRALVHGDFIARIGSSENARWHAWIDGVAEAFDGIIALRDHYHAGRGTSDAYRSGRMTGYAVAAHFGLVPL